MSHHPASNHNLPVNAHETGPPLSFQQLRDIELCDMFLDMLTLDDLKQNIIQEANDNTFGSSGMTMSELVTELKGNTDAAAMEMLRLLKKLGLKMAF